MTSGRPSQHAFVGVSALLFAVSAALTSGWCQSMSATGEMPMAGGWTMSMAWMRMPGQTWLDATASFVFMWVVMMMAMMLPSLVPILWRYRQSALNVTGGERLGRLTASIGVGYFSVWTVVGIVVFPLGAVLAQIEMRQPALARGVPLAVGVVFMIAGAVQFTAWKAHHLACCRKSPLAGCMPPSNLANAWRYGLRLGFHCTCGCAGLTAILLVSGVMDLRVMAAVTTAITLERLAPEGERVARAIGAVAIAAGMLLVAG